MRNCCLSAFRRLSGNKAAGIDEVTKDEYAGNLEANIEALLGRLHRMAYRPQPARRVYIPKPGSDKQRPLGACRNKTGATNEKGL